METGVDTRILQFRRFFQTTFAEVEDQAYNVFNSNSGGIIRMSGAPIQGNVETEAFFELTKDIIQERDIMKQTAVDDTFLQQTTKNRIKLHRRIGPWAYTLEEWNNMLLDPATAGTIIGRQGAVENQIKSLNLSILAVKTAISGNTDLITDQTAAPENFASWINIAKAERPFGDASHNLAGWVMHSLAYNDLYQHNLANHERLLQFGNVSVIRDPLGRIIVVTDSEHLFDADEGVYSILGLRTNAVQISRNHRVELEHTPLLGNENLAHRWQGEFNQTLEVHGSSWNEETGGQSPKIAAIGSSANWKPHFKSIKDSAGVILKVKGRV